MISKGDKVYEYKKNGMNRRLEIGNTVSIVGKGLKWKARKDPKRLLGMRSWQHIIGPADLEQKARCRSASDGMTPT